MELNLHSFTDTVALRCKTQHNKKKKHNILQNTTMKPKTENKKKKQKRNITI